MWTYLALASAILLGIYDVAKKQALKKNSVMWVLFVTTSLSCILLAPWFRLGPARDFLLLIPKGIFVAVSWIAGLIAMDRLPLTTASTLKASRPMFVVVFSVLLFGERLNLGQWAGVVLVLSGIFMLSRSSRREGIKFTHNAGVAWMCISILAGVVSALYDKWIMSWMDAMFVQCWSNLYIAAIMGLVLLFQRRRGTMEKFRPDPLLLCVALIIVISDALYFRALGCDGAMLSIISLIRRFSVVVTFMLSAVVFKERNIRSKTVDLAVMLVGLVLLFF